MKIGNAIRVCRIQRGLTQANLASRANISVPYLSLIEQGKRDPSFSMIEKISKSLQVPVSILTFLGADKSELSELTPELIDKISSTALELIREPINLETKL